ncbi:MAG: NADH-quinone oxidoreductase subunit N [Dehalococcoidia bacterium]|nr:NADH-quinone oxidoreductase subunit N [Dehalococcoidia bacterium]
MTLHDIYLLSPEISLAAIAMALILLDLVVSRKSILAVFGVVGLAIPVILSIVLWLDLDSSSTSQMQGVFGTLVVDKFSLFFKFLLSAAAALVILMSNGYVQRIRRFQGEFYGLVLLATTGMMLLPSATELISIYVALELTALPSAALAAFLRDGRSAESGMKFLILSAISSAVLLYGMVFIYGFTGTTSLEGIAAQIERLLSYGVLDPQAAFGDNKALLFGIILLIAGFGFKISSVPFQFWAPDVYEGAPTPITAFLSVASKAAGFAVILRLFYISFPFDVFSENWAAIFAILSIASMTFGNLVAIRQNNIKRMLAYSTIAHAGYVMVGLAAFAARAQTGSMDAGPSAVLFYLGGYVATNLLVFGAVIAVSNSINSDEIDDYGGLSRRAPMLAAGMAFAMISLIGIPPTIGFMSKVYLFGAAVNANLEWLAVAGMVNSVISAYYYLRVVKVMYLREPAEDKPLTSDAATGAALVVTAAATFIFGVYPTPLIDLARSAVGVLGV